MHFVQWITAWYVLMAIIVGAKGLRFAHAAFREGQYGASAFLFLFTMMFVVSGVVCIWKLAGSWTGLRMIPFSFGWLSGS